jgi:hypothetical protein
MLRSGGSGIRTVISIVLYVDEHLSEYFRIGVESERMNNPGREIASLGPTGNAVMVGLLVRFREGSDFIAELV